MEKNTMDGWGQNPHEQKTSPEEEKEGQIPQGPETSPGVEGIKGLEPIVPEAGETIMPLQVNAKDDRKNPESNEYGSLLPESREKIYEDAKKYFETILEQIPENEREQVKILIVSSDAELITPQGINSEHKRGVETAIEVMNGAREVLKEFNLQENQIINSSLPAMKTRSSDNLNIGELPNITDLKILKESPQFIEFLKEEYGDGWEFWEAYESGVYKTLSRYKELEGEKPEDVEDIADRMQRAIKMLKRYGDIIHKKNPNTRLIIWAVSHYDSISPFIKKNILKKPATDYLPIDKGGGVTLKIDTDGTVTTSIGEQNYNVQI